MNHPNHTQKSSKNEEVNDDIQKKEYKKGYKQSQKLEKSQKETIKAPRYNEKETITKFLKSEKGIPFLLNIGKTTSFRTENTQEEIEKLIDFYSSWTSSFPVRKNLKVSKYDFLKNVEEFCMKKENLNEIETIFGQDI